MAKRLTKAEVERDFKQYVLPSVKKQYEGRDHGGIDYPARSEAWAMYVDGLCKDGQVSQSQWNNWSAPACCCKK